MFYALHPALRSHHQISERPPSQRLALEISEADGVAAPIVPASVLWSPMELLRFARMSVVASRRNGRRDAEQKAPTLDTVRYYETKYSLEDATRPCWPSAPGQLVKRWLSARPESVTHDDYTWPRAAWMAAAAAPEAAYASLYGDLTIFSRVDFAHHRCCPQRMRRAMSSHLWPVASCPWRDRRCSTRGVCHPH